ncbi:MAG: RtcB family protein [Acidobacteria bacterium]|nr:RtcB family protein [Acidobacteriota bacterium]
MPIQQRHNLGGVPVKVWTTDIDPKAVVQLGEVSRLPIVAGSVAAMPDVHVGIGATVGSVIPTRKALIPAAVGVDIGCGMAAARLTLDAARLPDSLRGVREAIEDAVPVGFAAHGEPVADPGVLNELRPGLERIVERHPKVGSLVRDVRAKWPGQLGTLGGGNHFIEVCLDEADRVWVMLHSGSRGTGNALGRYFIRLAKRDMERHLARLPAKDLAYLEEGSDHFDDYAGAVRWAQRYALENRRLMMARILAALGTRLPPFRVDGTAVECHHNYVAEEEHFGEAVYVTRKGAIRAGRGELGIIPGSMGARSYIVRGRGSKDALDSCAHGAGRRMSRSQAKAAYTVADLERQTAGVECRKDRGVIDEIPGAYKDIDTVIANSSDLVDVVHTLKQVVCVKG